MKDNKTKKELIAKYKERKIVGGVFVIKNTMTNKALLDSTVDLQGSKNLFDFSQQTGSCANMKLQSDWAKQGGDKFVFETLEELEKGETQTPEEFADDIKLLKELWLEKLNKEDLY